MEPTSSCNINDIEASIRIPVWYHVNASGQPTALTSDEEELVEKGATFAEVEKYFCACGQMMSDWTDVTEHLSAPKRVGLAELVG
jgi:hypothetical protein